ncbi:MAG: DUF4349 domain-containing protein [Planctomycetes bacterium]|nr:DUF4349 domain-containing protein [Planctomycetota bacterium]
MRKLLMCTVLALSGMGCATTASSGGPAQVPAQANMDVEDSSASRRADPGINFNQDIRGRFTEAPLEGADLRIERAGWIRVDAGEEMEASKRLRRLAPTFDATVMAFNSHSVTFKMPSAKLEMLLETIENTAGWEMDEFDFSAWDRTGEYFSTEARIESGNAVKARLMKLLETAQTMDEVLKIHTGLEEIQKQLDGFSGQLRDIQLKAGRVDVVILFD